MTTPIVPSSYIIEDSAVIIMARILGVDAAEVQQADISTITYDVYDVTGANLDINDTSLTVASVIFDTLQTDALWTTDGTGYNFKATIPATAFPTGDNTYSIEFKFTDTNSNVWVMPVTLTTHQVHGA